MFCAHIRAKYTRLDALVNNACQTIRRPPAYYSHMLPLERAPEKAAAASSILPLLASHASYERALQGGASRRLALAGLSEEADQEPVISSSDAATGVEETVPSSTKRSHAGDAVSIAIHSDGGVAKAGNRRAAAASAELSQMPVIAGDTTAEKYMAKEKDATTGAMVAAMDQSGQQVDLRKQNSWLLKLEEVSVGEAAEVLAINTLAPFVLNAQLKQLMERTPEECVEHPSVASVASLCEVMVLCAPPFPPRSWKFIVNVSAMEGKFYRFKTANHPHTNMAKAALNMMTRTSAQDYRGSGIFMTAVDTGWINDEKPLEKAAAHEKRHAFQTPLDEVDAAARILDPILAPLAARDQCRGDEEALKLLPEPQYGVFLKDYMKTEW